MFMQLWQSYNIFFLPNYVNKSLGFSYIIAIQRATHCCSINSSTAILTVSTITISLLYNWSDFALQ